MASFEAEASKMVRKPYFDLGPDQQRERLALAQRMVRAILQDPEVSFRRDASDVVLLVGGSMENPGEVMAAAADVNAMPLMCYAVLAQCNCPCDKLCVCLVGALVMRCMRQGVR